MAKAKQHSRVNVGLVVLSYVPFVVPYLIVVPVGELTVTVIP